MANVRLIIVRCHGIAQERPSSVVLPGGGSFLRDGGDELLRSTSCRDASQRSFLSGSTRWTRRYLDVAGPVVLFGSSLPWVQFVLAHCPRASMASVIAFSFLSSQPSNKALKPTQVFWFAPSFVKTI